MDRTRIGKCYWKWDSPCHTLVYKSFKCEARKTNSDIPAGAIYRIQRRRLRRIHKPILRHIHPRPRARQQREDIPDGPPRVDRASAGPQSKLRLLIDPAERIEIARRRIVAHLSPERGRKGRVEGDVRGEDAAEVLVVMVAVVVVVVASGGSSDSRRPICTGDVCIFFVALRVRGAKPAEIGWMRGAILSVAQGG
jgi:hypothetical protein